jgi:uncharacterized membrane protein YphA (DoxX/SURF4 family)
MGQPPTTALKMPRAFFGRVILGAAMIAFGVEFALAGHPLDGLPPLPWFAPQPTILAMVMSIALPVLGVAVLSRFRIRESSFLLGIVLMAGAIPHLRHLPDVLHDPMERNRFLVPIALGCGAFVLCRLALQTERNYLFLAARALFAFILISFGLNHFLYTGLIAAQLPDWVVLHLLCVRFTGVCFLAAGLGILSGYLARPAALLLSLMFTLWFFVLDVPAIRADRLDANARIHGEVLFALVGAALLMATSPVVPSLHHEMAVDRISRGGR